jgi:preprotein translocase subunit SecG
MEVLKTILLVFQLISCAVLTVIILLQSSKSDGMSALTGGTDTFLGRSKAATLDAKLERLTKWVAAAFVLLTLFVALLYSM